MGGIFGGFSNTETTNECSEITRFLSHYLFSLFVVSCSNSTIHEYKGKRNEVEKKTTMYTYIHTYLGIYLYIYIYY